MKCFVRLFLLFLLCSGPGSALRADNLLGYSFPVCGARWPFPSGSFRLGMQTGPAITGIPRFGRREAFLPLTVTGDCSLTPHMAAGFYAGYYRATYLDEYLAEAYSARLVAWISGIRFTLHFADVLNRHLGAEIPVKIWDIYSSASLGVRGLDWQVARRFSGVRADFGGGIRATSGLVLGARYMAHPRISLHAEVGKGLFGFVAFGLSGRIW